MNKILEGAKEALAVARGDMPAMRIYTAAGAEYFGAGYQLIQHKFRDEWIVWNWKFGSWDHVKEPLRLIEP